MKRHIVTLTVTLLLLVMPLAVFADNPLDFPVANGHFFSQTASNDGKSGFSVVDDAEARFWSEFQRLGGVQGVGYPISQRYHWDGYVVQAMQRGIMQWRPEVSQAYFVNVLDQLSLAGKDEWLLSQRSTPLPLGPEFDADHSWQEIIFHRQALLAANPAISRVYHAAADPLTLYGLPTSAVVENDTHYVIRLQRAVIQQWKVASPWAAEGEVTVANGGALAMEAGLIPADSLVPSPVVATPAATTPPATSTPAPTATSAPNPQTPTPAPQPAPTGSYSQQAGELVNHYRALAGAAPLSVHPLIEAAATNHARYYELNYGDPNLAGMGLHEETPGNPGFTGAGIYERAKAVGYSGFMDENMGLVGDVQRMVDWCMDTVNHRWNMIHPSAVHIGYGLSRVHPVDVMNIGFTGARTSVSLPTVYPGVGQTGVPTSSYIYEVPDPAPGVPRPLGYPITVSFAIEDTVSFDNWSLAGADGVVLKTYSSERSWLNSLAIIPASPLESGATYTVTVSGTQNGKAFSKQWQFSTR